MYSDLSDIRDIGAVFEALLEALDPLEEGVAGGVAASMDEEAYGGQAVQVAAVS